MIIVYFCFIMYILEIKILLPQTFFRASNEIKWQRYNFSLPLKKSQTHTRRHTRTHSVPHTNKHFPHYILIIVFKFKEGTESIFRLGDWYIYLFIYTVCRTVVKLKNFMRVCMCVCECAHM